jgi:hypothetical protein
MLAGLVGAMALNARVAVVSCFYWHYRSLTGRGPCEAAEQHHS